MHIHDAIGELRDALANTTDETKLLAAIESGLDVLRAAFRTERGSFGQDDVHFLQSLSVVAGQLRELDALKQEVSLAGSVDEYESLLRRLRKLREALSGTAAAQSVSRVMQTLHGKLPALLERDASRQDFRRFRGQFQILGMQRTARLCGSGHPMMLLEGSEGLYWGCSQCGATSDLTADERAASRT